MVALQELQAGAVQACLGTKTFEKQKYFVQGGHGPQGLLLGSHQAMSADEGLSLLQEQPQEHRRESDGEPRVLGHLVDGHQCLPLQPGGFIEQVG